MWWILIPLIIASALVIAGGVMTFLAEGIVATIWFIARMIGLVIVLLFLLWFTLRLNIIIYRYQMRERIVTVVGIYLIAAFLFAGVYYAFWIYDHSRFTVTSDIVREELIAAGRKQVNGHIILGLSEFWYFSMITGGTLGYGDIVPNSPGMRFLTTVQLMVNVCILAFAIPFLWPGREEIEAEEEVPPEPMTPLM